MKIRKYQRPIAIFLLLNFLNLIFAPSLIYAGGITADEYDSFIPAGTTDMVNTLTGDFHYDVPLFDVPGPEGSYPIHLFYEAGIKNDKNASWTGLGWNLNVGAITREVNDIPDDFSNAPYVCDDNSSCNIYSSDFLSACSMGSQIAMQDIDKALFQPFLTDGTLRQYGVLHADSASAHNDGYYASFDCHALFPEHLNDSIVGATPEYTDGGNLPSYDEYNVSGEGLSGQIEPVILENGTLFRSINATIYTGNSTVTSQLQNSIGLNGVRALVGYRGFNIFRNFSQPKQYFRFKNEFSNSLVASSVNAFTYNSSNWGYNLGGNNLGYSYSLQDANGFNSSSMRLAGGKHVDYFLNTEITSGTAKAAGFLEYPYYINENGGYASSTSERKKLTYLSTQYDVSQRVGGFSITNEEGMTYHYALPAYTYKNVTTKTIVGTYTASRIATNAYPYAYSWLLTTVTGPDFIDKNNNGYADEGDLGQWTNFNYGKATSGYYFQNPYTGYTITTDGMQVSSSGYKELYFLDAVYTRSHTALFSKGSRTDAKDAAGTASALKLNSAILFHNDGIKAISNGMSWTYSDLYTAIKNIKGANSSYNTSVITVEDITTISGTSGTSYASQILKESKLTYDYSLAVGAPNSATGTGKLTLNSVRTFGKNNSPLGPSTNFTYELSSPQSTSITFTSITYPPVDVPMFATGTISVPTNLFAEGDIVKFTLSGTTFYCTLTKALSSTTYNVLFLGGGSTLGGLVSTGTAYTATQTKNPPYTVYPPTRGSNLFGNMVDQWGYFKTDMAYPTSVLDMKTTYASAQAADCWSLRKITTALGGTIEINYEPDSYFDYQFTEGEIFNINQSFKYTDASSLSLSSSAAECDFRNVKADTAGVFEFTIHEDITGKFSVGQTIEIATLGTFTYNCTLLQWVSKAGKDSFYITYVDTVNKVIRGKFRLPATGSKTNPFWTTPYGSGCANIFYHNSSFIIQKNPTVSYGGGTRVKSITVKEGNGEVYTTSYNYNNRLTGLTSGTCAFDPMIETNLIIPVADGLTQYPYGTAIYYNADFKATSPQYITQLGQYQGRNTQIVLKALANMDFISPEVLYELVTVSSTGNNNTYLKSTEYQYQPYTWNMIQRSTSNIVRSVNGTFGVFGGEVTIQDYTSSACQLLATREYDVSGNMVSLTSYTYTSAPPSSQGRLDQVFHENGVANYVLFGYSVEDGLDFGKVTMLSRYPSVISRITTTNYLKNITSFKDFYSFDFYSGNPTETVSKNSEGDYFKQRQVLAYTKSQYAGMGLKFSSSTNRNLLSPSTASYVYKVNSSNYATHIDTLACSVNTWNNIWTKRAFNSTNSIYSDSTVSTDNSATVQDDRIWRPQSSYAWKSPLLNSDGSYKNFVDFNWAGAKHQNWQRFDSISKYDQFSNVLERVDINGNYSTIKYGYDCTYPLTASDNANYNELAYSGAEDINSNSNYGSIAYLGSEVATGGSGSERLDNTKAHSGLSSIKLTQNQWGFIFESPITAGGIALGKTYRASVWVYDNGNTSANLYYVVSDASYNYVTMGAVSPASMTPAPVSVNGWKLLTLDYTIPGGYSNYHLAIGCNNPSSMPAWFDDLRFHPLSETISSNVYDKASGLVTHSLDKNNFYSRRAYDNMFRPTSDYKETIYGEMKMKEYQYNYGKRQ
jgi:hypothetical protein